MHLDGSTGDVSQDREPRLVHLPGHAELKHSGGLRGAAHVMRTDDERSGTDLYDGLEAKEQKATIVLKGTITSRHNGCRGSQRSP